MIMGFLLILERIKVPLTAPSMVTLIGINTTDPKTLTGFSVRREFMVGGQSKCNHVRVSATKRHSVALCLTKKGDN